MLSLFRAEWQKIVGNRTLLGFTLGIYPFGAVAFILFMTVVALIAAEVAGAVIGGWTAGMLNSLGIVTRFPGNLMGRLPLVAFMAVFFAGEYEWNTWKNIVPRNRRAAIIVTKFATLSLLVTIGLGLTSLVWGAGRALPVAIAGAEYGPPLSGQVLADFVPDYVLEIGLVFAESLLLAGYAALSVMLTRSMIGGLLLGLGLSLVEILLGPLLQFIAFVSKKPGAVNQYVFTPTYTLDNIRSWVTNGAAWVQGESSILVSGWPGLARELSLIGSLLVLAVWVVGLIALVVFLFQRQDLSS